MFRKFAPMAALAVTLLMTSTAVRADSPAALHDGMRQLSYVVEPSFGPRSLLIDDNDAAHQHHQDYDGNSYADSVSANELDGAIAKRVFARENGPAFQVPADVF